jgi:hypothetical protein
MPPGPPIGEDDGDPWNFDLDLSAYRRISPEARAEAERIVSAMRTPLAPGDPRDHHYIPRWFLRRFSDDGAIIRVPLSDPAASQAASVETVAFVRDFYTTLDHEVGATVLVERLLAVVDGEAARAVDRLAAGVLFPPSAADRVAIATWLALLFVRTPAHRRQAEAMSDFAFKMEMSLITDEGRARGFLERRGGTPPTEQEVADLLEFVANLDDVEVSPHQNTMVHDMLRVGFGMTPYFLNRHWVVLRFPEDGLILPDQPITLYAARRSPMMGVGVATADELIVPIDRRTALIMHLDERVGDRVVDAAPGQTVDGFNQHVAGSTFREVFCYPDDVARLDAIQLPEPNRPVASASVG